MLKLVFILVFIFFFLIKNHILIFMYNLCFFIRFIVLMSYRRFNESIIRIIRIFTIFNYYTFILLIIRLWIVGLMFIRLEKRVEKIKKVVFIVILLILVVFFLITNIILFYFCFEIRLIPTFILINYWGYRPERLRAAYYILMYTLLISLPFFVYLIELYNRIGRIFFYIILLENVELRFWGFLVVIGAFFVKIPIFLFHIWLPKAHVEAPVYGSIILAGILLKLGSYGLLWFLIFFIKRRIKFRSVIMRLVLVGRVIIRFLCIIQIDIKMIVAYSSVVHINIMLCGLIRICKLGYIRAYIIIISHGLCSSGLFYIVNLYYYRSSRRLLILNKGLVNLLPSFTLWWFLLCSSNFSYPLSIGFIREIYLLGVIIRWDIILIIYLIIVGFFRRAYSLYLFSYVQYGEIVEIKKFIGGRIKENLVVLFHIYPIIFILIRIHLY